MMIKTRLFRRKTTEVIQNRLNFLLASQYWPLDKLKIFQWQKLKILLAHSYQNVPYYHNIFKKNNLTVEDIKSPQDFEKIPILTKRDIQENLEALISKSLDKEDEEKSYLNSTGGSTGTPLNFYQDKDYIDWADAARIRAWKYFVGFEKNTLEAVLWGAERDIGKGLNIKKVLYQSLRDGNLNLNTFDLDSGIIRKYFFYFNMLRPEILRGYASSLFYIAKFIEENNLKIYHPQSIISSSEYLRPFMRKKIEEVFKAEVFDSYGCREVSQIATECKAHHGLHIVMENQYVELVNNNIIVTNLNNFIMPFIRYQVGDMAEGITDTPCTCGRYSPRLTKLQGRDNENIILEDKKVINGEFFEFLFFGYKSVEQYQVVYYKKTHKLQIRLRVKNESENISEIVKKIIYEKFNFSNVETIITNEFDKTPTGKLKFVFSIDE